MSERPPLFGARRLLGTVRAERTDLRRFLSEAATECGDLFSVQLSGSIVPVLAGRSAVTLLESKEAEYLARGTSYVRMAARRGYPGFLPSLDGVEHARVRDALEACVTRHVLEPAVPELVARIAEVARAWPRGRALSAAEVLPPIFVDAAGVGLMGCPVSRERSDAVVDFARAVIDGDPDEANDAAGSRAAFASLVDDVVARHATREGEERPGDLVDAVVGAARGGRGLTSEEVPGALASVLLKSALHTSTVFGHLLRELLDAEVSLERALSEVDEVLASGTPTLGVLQRMGFVRACVREALRLHPPVMLLPRRLRRDLVVGDYTVESGEDVLLAPAVLHFSERSFARPWTFEPERFLPPRNEHRQPGVLAPFGAGRHQCLGAALAETMLLVAATGVLGAVSLESARSGLARGVPGDLPGPTGWRFRIAKRRAGPEIDAGTGLLEDRDLALLLPAQDLTMDSQARLLSRFRRDRFEPGEIIIQEGRPPVDFFIVAEGSVRVVRDREVGPPVHVATLGKGECFGEIGLLYDAPRNASVVAGESGALVLALHREIFREVVAASDLTAREIAVLVEQRMTALRLRDALPRLTDEQIREVAPRFETLMFEPKTEIIREGEAAERFYVITRGYVEVTSRHPRGSEVFLARLGPGEYFGEIGLLDHRVRVATVRSAEWPVETIALARDDFHALLSDSAETETQLARKMVERLIAQAGGGSAPSG